MIIFISKKKKKKKKKKKYHLIAYTIQHFFMIHWYNSKSSLSV
ncbi:hypothetical protein HanPI659440_Chr12g0450151 [Helianthus annuus]|nr:hypothetical protein HanPI659440_Chr12g0450151 [Helianthus annuus]